MNIARSDKIVLLGFLSHFPVAGVAWQTIHYLVGLQRLGFDVFYVEAHGCTPTKLMRSHTDDGPRLAAEYISRVMRRFDLDGRWAYHALYPEARYFGLTETQLKQLYRDAALIINLHGSHVPTAELAADNRLVYVESDPVEVEIDLFQNEDLRKKQATIDYLAPHMAFFTYGENLGNADCLVPTPQPFKFLPTRQPVVMDFWEDYGRNDATTFTTIGNWRQPAREVKFNGEVYRWSKHFEFLKFIDLPHRVSQPFELAMSSASYNAGDKRLLENKDWRVRDALEFSNDLDAYRRYIGESRGEFTVAKDQNVRLRSGWFSDRAVTYLAAGRPVITQETGFSNILPTGEGLFAFSTMEEIVAAVEAINADYDRHRRAARTIARECFSHEVVLTRLLRDLGLPIKKSEIRKQKAEIDESLSMTPEQRTALSAERSAWTEAADKAVRNSRAKEPLTVPDGEVLLASAAECGSPLPSTLVLSPTGRWPTRLPAETVQTALALATPAAERGQIVGQPSRLPSSQQPSRLPGAAASETLAGTAAGEDACTTRQSGAPAKRASIIIVTYNGLLYTKMCVVTLLRNGWLPDDELIIVDNASTDGTPDYLRELARLNPFVRIVFNEHNRGFAAANNQGFSMATGDVLILLNNDTLVPRGWRNGLVQWLDDPGIGMIGPVTNRIGNEAQVETCYRTYGEMEQFAHDCTRQHHGKAADIPMLAMFCVAMRRDVFERVGPLDEQFEVGMFEDDDYARRVRQADYTIVCADDVFVHHFGQGSFGELGPGTYDRILEANRRRFENKWGVTWQPPGRRISPEYQRLRERIQTTATTCLPPGATVLVISKGDEELLKSNGRRAWHFPQTPDGKYPGHYPADSAEAIAHLEALRAKGANFLLIPKPAFWWLDHYSEFNNHLHRQYRLTVRDAESCLIFDLGA